MLLESVSPLVYDGDHNTMMKKNGLYAKMYEAQARWYMEDIGLKREEVYSLF